MSEHDIGELAHEDESRCVFTVHANGNWGDYRCELAVEHSGPHAIGLRHHAVPLIITLESELEKMEQAFRGRGFHEPGMKRCPHGMSHWIGSHCMYDEPILAARKD